MDETGEALENRIIIDSNLTLEQALSLRQAIEPPKEVLDRLGIVDVTYYSFDGKLHKGQVVIDKELINDVRGVFDLITELRFPVSSVIPKMDRVFMDNAEKATTVNNSVGFSYRYVAGTERLSNHSFGRAFDINPQNNPFTKSGYEYGTVYDPISPGTLTEDSEIVRFMKEKGWEWGGEWMGKKGYIDYMHFEKPMS
jgi:peptidoglycan LD-endopeptidase CwlK